MAFTAGDVRDEVLKRVRAYGGISFTDAWARNILCICERTVNAGIRSVLESTNVTTVAYQTLYDLRADFSTNLYDAIDIVSVEHSDASGSYEVRKCTLEDLFGYNASWFRDTTTNRFLWYWQVGRDLLLLYPAFSSAKTVTITYSVQTTALAADVTEMDTPEEDVPMVSDLAEVVLLAALRITPVAQLKAKALMDKIGLDLETK